MELYFAATGVEHELDYFEKQMQFQPCLLPFKDKDGKVHQQPLYAILAPMRLYRFVFPKEHLNEFIKTLEFDNPNEQHYSGFDKQKFLLRKILKAQPIPEIPKDTKPRLFRKGNIGLIGIGIKEDKDVTDEMGRTHEGI